MSLCLRSVYIYTSNANNFVELSAVAGSNLPLFGVKNFPHISDLDKQPLLLV